MIQGLDSRLDCNETRSKPLGGQAIASTFLLHAGTIADRSETSPQKACGATGLAFRGGKTLHEGT
jgi:hypothetical protein